MRCNSQGDDSIKLSKAHEVLPDIGYNVTVKQNPPGSFLPAHLKEYDVFVLTTHGVDGGGFQVGLDDGSPAYVLYEYINQWLDGGGLDYVHLLGCYVGNEANEFKTAFNADTYYTLQTPNETVTNVHLFVHEIWFWNEIEAGATISAAAAKADLECRQNADVLTWYNDNNFPIPEPLILGNANLKLKCN